MADFDPIANWYNLLKKMVFNNQIEEATRYFLGFIPSYSKILIIGGGTGHILSCFNSTHQIKYVELSRAMLNKAKKVNSKASIEFINSDVLKWESDEKFDFILTPFILDCFNEASINSLMTKLKNNLTEKASWIHTDFYPKNVLQRYLVRAMYFFFRITAKLKVTALADFDYLFQKHKFICTRNALFFHSMIESKIYRQIE
ncbi:class I SAM-dependent methyltransferase [Marivirga sp.]|uniref:class I SAM-dependent methyltransferase n=1 Tax=Marivirga sp. TaxID=2018662 RepID=UPI003DA747A3